MWPFLQHARERLQAFLNEIRRLEQSEFPYEHPKQALVELRTKFQARLARLEAFTQASDRDTVKQECALSLRDLFEYLPLLGFILRSTNVRNTFEVFRPLLELVRHLLDGSVPNPRPTKLVLSSEWDYSPLMYDQIPELPTFIFIGLPACESSNPLLIPLAGHEVGHAVWRRHAVEVTLKPRISAAVVASIQANWNNYVQLWNLPAGLRQTDLSTDLFLIQTWAPIASWALEQAQESFCDFVGLLLFGQSYLFAFEYLLSPTQLNGRSPLYPDTLVRARNLCIAANAYGIVTTTNYENSFQSELYANPDPYSRFSLEMADSALSVVLQDIIALVQNLVTCAGIASRSNQETSRVYERFKLIVPAEGCKSIADIVNAGWLAAMDEALWRDSDHVFSKKDAIVKELVLKTIEVFQIERIRDDA